MDAAELPGAAIAAVEVARRAAVALVRRYNSLSIEVGSPLPSEPSLIVGNHGFGGAVDLNVLAMLAVLEDLADRPVTLLTHQLAWTLKVGVLLETIGCRPASERNALEAFEKGHHVVVFPGGDLEAAKTYPDRNRVMFCGRDGFAALAIRTGVPVVPVVTAGAGESLLVLNDGRWLAKTLRTDRLLRTKALPVSISIPWGLNAGLVGIVPYVPLPTKLQTCVMPALHPGASESASEFALRVEDEMQGTLTRITAGRRPLG